MRLTDTSNGTPTDMYVSVKEDESLSLNSYGEINTLYKRTKDKVKPVNGPHKEGLKPEASAKKNSIVTRYISMYA